MIDRIGRYEVLSHLASGGMGSVYLARGSGPAGFERHVALKLLETRDDDEAIAMFLDEARLIGRMHHQHIASAYELGCGDDGHHFLVTDYIHGQTAKAVWQRTLRRGLMLPLNFTLTVALAAASALRYVHGLSSRDGKPLDIVHRDVSLSNLMIGYDGAIKLIDFGIAKAALRRSATRIGEIKGNACYMAPEQAAGRAVDHRTDIFALGTVLYELATMTRAFRARTEHESLLRVQRGDVTPPSHVIDDFPADLEEIILTALAVDPAHRFQDAGTLQRELEGFARRHGIVIGDSAIVSVMEVLFDNRDEPWQLGDGRVAAAEDDATTDPIEMFELEPEHWLPTPVTVEEFRRPAPTGQPALAASAAPRIVADEMSTQPLRPAPATTPSIALGLSRERKVTPPNEYPVGSSLFPVVAPPVDPIETAMVVAAPPRAQPTPKLTALAQRARARWPWLAATVLLAALAVAISVQRSRDDDRAVAVRTPTSAPHAAPADRTGGGAAIALSAPPAAIVTPIEPVAPPTTVWLRVTTTPDDATVLLDGKRLGRTPFADTFPAGDVHKLKIRRRGYLPQWHDIDMRSDVTRHVVLRELRTPPP
jgi:serine/threonine-protein kinase